MLRSHGHSGLARLYSFLFSFSGPVPVQRERKLRLIRSGFLFAGELSRAVCVYYAIVGIQPALSRNVLGLMYQWTRSPEPPLYTQINLSDFLSYCRCCTALQERSRIINICIRQREIWQVTKTHKVNGMEKCK